LSCRFIQKKIEDLYKLIFANTGNFNRHLYFASILEDTLLKDKIGLMK